VENEELNMFTRICNRLGIRGWCPGSSGNASFLVPDRGLVYIKTSGKPMAFLSTSDVVAIDMDGNVVEGKGKPSKEFKFHLGIYKIRKDVKAVIHTHSPYATAFAIANKGLPMKTTPGRIVLKKVPSIAYASPGSEDLALRVVECFKDEEVHAALLRDHGVVATGKTLIEANSIAEWVEDAAKEVFLSLIISSS